VKELDRIMSGVWNGDLLCFLCGGHETNVLPNDLDVVIKRVKAFHKAHAKCKWTPAGSELRARHDGDWRKLRGEQ
jgi:hypothetical protein